MQPTQDPTPAPAPPVIGGALVEFFARDRQRAGTVLLGLSTLLLVVGLFCVWSAVRIGRGPDDAPKEDPVASAQPGQRPRAKEARADDFKLGAVASGAVFLAVLGVGAWLVIGLPATDEAKRRTQARAAILATGAGVGLALMISGVLFFYRFSDALADWLDRGQDARAKYVLVPFLAIVFGAALAFFAVLPCRAEERDNPQLRRWAYGTNFVIGVLVLFVGLLVVNLILAPRLPNRLDTTSAGFYSLSPNTVALLQKLPEPVTAHVVLTGGRTQESLRVAEDTRRLMSNCADASGGKFTARFYSGTSDVTDYQQLVAKYPIFEANETGVLLTIGADGKRHTLIRETEFSQSAAPGGQGGSAFVGESRLVKELLFLAENEQKAIVYFTQSSGELPLNAQQAEAAQQGSVARLSEYLGRNNLEVRPLRFDPKDVKVPDDAAVVVVVEPAQPLPADQVTALRRYMSEPRPGGKKGKLIVLAGATFGPQPKLEVLATGLEPLLAEYGVSLEQRFILFEPGRERDLPPAVAVARFAQAAVNARNPIALSLGQTSSYRGALWREVTALPQGAPGARPTPLLYTVPGRFSWLEDRAPVKDGYARAYDELRQSAQARAVKRFTDASRPVGIAVADGDAGRMVVIGNSDMVTDAAADLSEGGFELVGAAVDWLRDRPALTYDVQTKKYQKFTFPADADPNRGLWLPLVIGMVAVLGLGSAVWVVRRRTA